MSVAHECDSVGLEKVQVLRKYVDSFVEKHTKTTVAITIPRAQHI